MRKWKHECVHVFGHVCMKLCPKVTWGSDSVTDRQAKTVKPCRTLVKDWIVISQHADETAAVPLLEQTLTELQHAVTFSDCTSVTIKFSHSKYFPSLKFWIPCFSYASFGCNYRSLLTGDWRGAHVFSWGLAATVILPVWQDGMKSCGPNYHFYKYPKAEIYCKIWTDCCSW